MMGTARPVASMKTEGGQIPRCIKNQCTQGGSKRYPWTFENLEKPESPCIWQFTIPGTAITSNWEEICGRYNPVRTLYAKGGTLTAGIEVLPRPETSARRILIRRAIDKAHTICHFGPCNSETALIMQYHWQGDTPLLNTSTGQLHHIQAQQRSTQHSALGRWPTALACTIPPEIWRSTWANFRGASENVFLWQQLYQIIATQHWRFPRSLATDTHTWCTRCSIGIREDVIHCLWACPTSAHCWRWCKFLLGLASTNGPSHQRSCLCLCLWPGRNPMNGTSRSNYGRFYDWCSTGRSGRTGTATSWLGIHLATTE